MFLEQSLIDAAVAEADRRFPSGPRGAAALMTKDGSVLTSVGLESVNEAANLCYETGAICEAFRLEKQVVATACVLWDDTLARYLILPPCGVCQERLFIWGAGVEAATPVAGKPGEWTCKTLGELQPYYWASYLSG